MRVLMWFFLIDLTGSFDGFSLRNFSDLGRCPIEFAKWAKADLIRSLSPIAIYEYTP